MNLILREMYTILSLSQNIRRACWGVGCGLIALGCGGLFTASLLITHASHWPLVSLMLLTSGCTILTITHKEGKSHPVNTAHVGITCVAVMIAIILSTVFITGDVRSWILVALVSAIAIMISYRT